MRLRLTLLCISSLLLLSACTQTARQAATPAPNPVAVTKAGANVELAKKQKYLGSVPCLHEPPKFCQPKGSGWSACSTQGAQCYGHKIATNQWTDAKTGLTPVCLGGKAADPHAVCSSVK